MNGARSFPFQGVSPLYNISSGKFCQEFMSQLLSPEVYHRHLRTLGFFSLPGHDVLDISLQEFRERMLRLPLGEMPTLYHLPFNHRCPLLGVFSCGKCSTLGLFPPPSDTNIIGSLSIL